MKYYKKDNKVFAFEDDGSQDSFITDEMILMTADEIDRHLNPEKYLTEDQKNAVYVASLRPLTRRQFMLTLVEYGLDDDIAAAINAIEDEKQRKIINIEFNNSQTFERFSDSVLFMCSLLGLEETRVNELWEYGMRL